MCFPTPFPSSPSPLTSPCGGCLPPVVGQEQIDPSPQTYPTLLQDTQGRVLCIHCVWAIMCCMCGWSGCTCVCVLMQQTNILKLCPCSLLTPLPSPLCCLHNTPTFLLRQQVLHLYISLVTPSLDVPGPSWWTPPPSGRRRHSRQWKEKESRPAQRIRGTQTVSSSAS